MTSHIPIEPAATSSARRGVFSEAKPSKNVNESRRAIGRARSGRTRNPRSRKRSVAGLQRTAKSATATGLALVAHAVSFVPISIIGFAFFAASPFKKDGLKDLAVPDVGGPNLG